MNDLAHISKIWIDYREMCRMIERCPSNPHYQIAAALLQTQLVCEMACYWAGVRVPYHWEESNDRKHLD